VNRWKRCKRRDFIDRLLALGFTGPYSGTKHQFMIYRQCRLAIPSNTDFSIPQLHMLIREIEEILGQRLSAESWNNLLG
jgi:hypothetical protein